MRYFEVLVMMSFVGTVTAQEGSPQFQRLDRNRDGVLTPNEFPEQSRPNFARIDTNGDGQISLTEDAAFQSRMNRTASSLPKGVTIQRDLPYVANGHARQVLDLYLPASNGKRRPLVIWVHGGGWQGGDKAGGPWRPLLEQGFAVAAINYRFSSHAVFPAQIHDCKAAVRWLRDHADDYELDPERFGAWGSSAGGHLVALLGTSGDVAELEDTKSTTSSRVQAVCDWFGPTDFLLKSPASGAGRTPDRDGPNSPVTQLLGGPLQTRLAAARQASPVTYISADDPPFLIVHGDADTVVELRQSEVLLEGLTATGVPAELKVIPRAGHGHFKDPAIAQNCTAFFVKTLQAKTSK